MARAGAVPGSRLSLSIKQVSFTYFALEFYLAWFLLLNTLKRLFNTNMNEITELPLEVTLTTSPHHRSKMETLGRSGLKPE